MINVLLVFFICQAQPYNEEDDKHNAPENRRRRWKLS